MKHQFDKYKNGDTILKPEWLGIIDWKKGCHMNLDYKQESIINNITNNITEEENIDTDINNTNNNTNTNFNHNFIKQNS